MPDDQPISPDLVAAFAAWLSIVLDRYLNALYDTGELEEVLFNFPDNEWMLGSLACLDPDDPVKAAVLVKYVRQHPNERLIRQRPSQAFVAAWTQHAEP